MRFNTKQLFLKDEIIHNAYIVIEDKKIKEIGEYEGKDYDADIIVPGIFDIHSHGAMGYSATTTSLDDLYGYTKAIAKDGITSVLATTQELDSLSLIAGAIESGVVKGAKIIGINAEGPFRNKKYMGASKGMVWPLPSIEYSKKMIDSAKGHIMYMSVSSELEKMDEIIPYLAKNNIRVAGGHTDATYSEMIDGFKLGVTAISHFGNAMRPFHQREGGALTACLLNDDIYLEINADHVHLSKEVLALFFKTRGMKNFILISDSSECAGLDEGVYFARGKKRYVDRNGDIKTEDGTISGSGHPIIYDIKKLILEDGYHPIDIINMATYNPCHYFNIENKGSIKVGNDADIILLNNSYEVLKTIVEGSIEYDINIKEDLRNPKMQKLNEN